MQSKFITRQQYDLLVTHCPNWMELRWQEFSKIWSIGGVTVKGKDFQIENLVDQLQYSEQLSVR